MEPFKHHSKTRLLERRIFTLHAEQVVHPRTARAMEITVMEAPDWCNIIPLTPGGDVVMVKQWRFGTRAFTLEIPGGMVESGEEPGAAARREMQEETGYDSLDVVRTGCVSANPSIQNNHVHSYFARGVHSIGAARPDAGEDVETVLVPLKEIPALIANGTVDHSLVVAAFFHLANAHGGKLGAAA